jgi:hypothetical protein
MCERFGLSLELDRAEPFRRVLRDALALEVGTVTPDLDGLRRQNGGDDLTVKVDDPLEPERARAAYRDDVRVELAQWAFVMSTYDPNTQVHAGLR